MNTEEALLMFGLNAAGSFAAMVANEGLKQVLAPNSTYGFV